MSVFTLKRFRIYLLYSLIALALCLVGYGLFSVAGLSLSWLFRPDSTHLSPLQKVTIGQPVNTKALASLPGYQARQATNSGTVFYTYNSYLPLHSSEVVGAQGKAVFERIVTPQDLNEVGYATLSSYEDKYGDPDSVVSGSKTYGWFMKTYIYATKGFAFIANPNTGVIVEIQRFSPMSVSSYTQQYGQDLNPGAGPVGE